MFDAISNIYITAGIALLTVIVWLACVQYSEFTLHRKQHQNDADPKSKELADKFCYIPYLVIPILGGVLATFIGLMFTNYAITQSLISSEETVYAVAIMASLVTYGILDITFFAKIGDVAYFRFFEEKFLKAVDEPEAEQTVDKDMSQEEIIVLLSKLLKK